MILAIDTATNWTALALHDGNAIVAEYGWHANKTQTVELTPMIASMLTQAGIDSADLKGIAVAIGPGSYTGLRIGVGVAKGVSLAHSIPLVGVSTLDILAASFGRGDGNLITVAEAGRSRISTATYRWDNRQGWKLITAPDIESWDQLLARLDDETPTSITGEISVTARKLVRAAPRNIRLIEVASNVRRAGYLADIGWRRLRRGKADDAAALVPIYLRDAEGNRPA